MYRKLASVLLVASALQAKYAFALGLGEMTMHSALNEPLNAEIQLNNTNDLDQTQILVSLGSQKQFEDAGIDRTFYLSNIKFTVVTDNNGGGVVKLFSTKRLNEPFLDFLLEAKWPTGRVLRSYTALVDLPVYAEASKETVSLGAAPKVSTQTTPVIPAEPVSVPSEPSSSAVAPSSEAVASVSAPAPTAETAPVIQETPSVVAPEIVAEPVAEREAFVEPAPVVTQEPDVSYEVESTSYTGDSYTVQQNDTLWEIARDIRPSNNMSVQQVMLALQRYNENAFIGGNINRLKAGVTLTLPDAGMIREMSAREAIGEVREQNQQWQNAQLDATSSSSSSYSSYESSEEGHLSLSSAGSGVANGNDKAGADSGLRNQLNDTKDQLATTERENQELSGKLGSLNTQVDKLERLLELKSTELAELQQQMGKEAAASEEAKALEQAIEKEKAEVKAAEAELEKAQAAEKGEVVENTADQSAAVAPSVSAEAKDSVDVAPEADVVVEEQPVEPKQGLMDKVLANPMYLGGIAIFIVALVAFILLRRKSKAEQAAFDEFEHFEFDSEDESEQTVEESSAEVEAEAEAEAEELDAPIEELAEAEAEVELDLDEPDAELEQPTTVQTGDAIGEAEIYIAYGRFEQAADLLKGAIASSPDNVELRSKLLEVYVESQNKDGFQEQFVALQGLAADDAITQAKELLTSQEGVSDWLNDLPAGPGPAEVESVSEIDLSAEDSLDLDLLDESAADAHDDTIVRDGISLRGFDEDEADASLDADTFDLDVGLDESVEGDSALDDLDVSLDGFDDVEVDLSSEFETESELEPEAEEIDLDLDLADEESVEVDEVSLDLDDDLSLDLSSIELDDLSDESDSAESSVADELDIGDLDLGLDDSVSLDVEEDLDGLELDLGEELDLSTDIEPLDEPVEEIDTAGLELDDTADLNLDDLGDLDVELDVEDSVDVGSLGDETLAAVDELEEIVEEALDEPADEPVQEVEPEKVEEPALADSEGDSPLATLEGEDLEFLSDADEISTKLDLARAYVEMGDLDGAKDILDEVLSEGNESQKSEANAMIEGLD